MTLNDDVLLLKEVPTSADDMHPLVSANKTTCPWV
jgi:hypothetical protein